MNTINSFFIAGPCVIEDDATMFCIAEELKRISETYKILIYFKASFDKANRTSLHSYRGPGLEKGLNILEKVKVRYNLPITTDIHEPFQADIVAEIADIIQIPALLSRQTDLIVAAAKTGKIVNIKKGQFLSAEDMKYPFMKAKESGGKNVYITERGNMFGYNNVIVDFRNLTDMKTFADKVIMDCTHSIQRPGTEKGISGGSPQYIEPTAKAAKAFGADGYFFEVHPTPDSALCDAKCMLKLDKLEKIIKQLI